MSELTQDQEISLIRVLTDFPNYFDNFQKNFQGLLSQSTYIVTKHPELKPEYDALVNRASINYSKLVTIKNAVDKIKNVGESITSWVKGVFGLNGLGIAPIIIAGISAGSAYAVIASVAKWFTDANTFAKKLDYIREQESKGISSQQAAIAANKIFGETSGDTFFGLPIKWIIVGAVLIFLGPPLINAFTAKRK